MDCEAEEEDLCEVLSAVRVIGICIGDVTGIGPEVALKAVAEEVKRDDGFDYLLIGDTRHCRELNEKLGLGLSFEAEDMNSPARRRRSQVRVRDAGVALPESIEQGSKVAADAAMAWLKEAGEACLRGEVAGMVTAPVNKEAIVRAGHRFVGQTEFLSELAQTKRTAMMLLGEDDRGRWLRVALVTTHVPLKSVSEKLTPEKISLAIELAAKACGDLNLSRARVAVCGLNPHAGEGGHMGTEEIDVIEPAVKDAKGRGIDAVGPLSADALFYYAYRGDYDAVVAMYHDQGLVPLKMIGFEKGVNWTLGLPFVRTSPDHGTAYDIAGKGKANASSMIAAIELAKKLAMARSETLT
jgi:4-hydroxythreonine-4-phosphate dehydrogenase